MEENTIKLPEEIFGKENGKYEGENYQLTCTNQDFIWQLSYFP